jgi:hypothetical protein
MKRRIRHVPEFEFCIEGLARFDNCKEYISEKVKAYSEDQAFWRLAERLERQRKQSVYLGDCRIYTTRILPPDNLVKKLPHKKIEETQLCINFLPKAP